MKKMNKKGFTLIELLAVITIMGILMLVSIPAVSRTIENTRRSTFANTAKTYINEIKTAVASDELKCSSTMISALGTGNYYYEFDSNNNSGKDLVEQGGRSSWGNVHVKGYVRVQKTVNANGKTKYTYYIKMTDTQGRGIQTETEETNITRSSVATSLPSGKTAAAVYNGSVAPSGSNKLSLID